MTTRTKIIAVSGTAGLLALLALWFAYRPPKKQSVAEVGIGTFSQAIDYGPVYVARHFGWFEQALDAADGSKPVYLELGGFDEIQTALAQGRLHAFFSAEAPVIKLVSDKQPIRIVAIGCTLQQEVLVRTDRKVNSIADLKQKTVAVAEGTSSHFGLLSILGSAGLSSKDITLRPGFPGEIKPLYESGGVDAWAVWPPFVEEQIIAGRGVALTGGEAKIQSVMSLHRTIIETNTPVGQTLVGTIRRAKTWMRANQEEAITIVAQSLRMDRAVVAMSWPKHNWGAELDESVLADIEAKAVFLKSVGVVSESAPVPTRRDLVDQEHSWR
jgi:sulfonate transport system substrate-binding protein